MTARELIRVMHSRSRRYFSPPLARMGQCLWPVTELYCGQQKLAAYDEDAALSVSTLLALPTCNGRIGATGMCLGGHLAYRCALDQRVAAAVCYFATDIHSHSLGEGMKDDSLERTGEIKGELAMVRTIYLTIPGIARGFHSQLRLT